MVVGGITSVVVMVRISVVHRIERVHSVEVARRITTRRRRQDWIVAVVVVTVGMRAVVVARTRTHVDHHPGLIAVTVPAEADWFEVFKDSEAEEVFVHLIVGHHCVNPRGVQAIGRDVDGDSSDSTGIDSHIFSGVVVTIVRIQIDINVSSVGIVSNVLDIVIDGDRIGIVGQHGL